MKYFSIILVHILICSLPCIANADTSPSSSYWSPEKAMQTKNIDDIRLSPDNLKIAYAITQYMHSNGSWSTHHQIYISNINKKTSKQFTFTGNNHLPKWSPNNKYIAFLSDRSGVSNVWIKPVSGNISKQLTHSKTSISYFKWSSDSKHIAYIKHTYKKVNQKPHPIRLPITGHTSNHIWLANIDNHTINYSLANPTPDHTCNMILGFDWAPSGKKIVLSCSTGKLKLINIATKKAILLTSTSPVAHKPFVTKPQAPVSGRDPIYSHSGKYIAFLSGFNTYIIAVDGGKTTKLYNTYEIPMGIAGWSHDDKAIYQIQRLHTYTSIIALPVDGGGPKTISAPHYLINDLILSDTGNKMTFSMQNSNSPIEAYISNVNTFKPNKITHINKEIADKTWGKTSIIQWKASDGIKIEGLLTYPVNYNPSKKYPLLVELHGGPDDCFQERFIGRPSVFQISSFSSLGYIYFRPNIRGSSAYGAKFRKLNHKDWAGMDYQDIISGIGFLIKKGMVDPKRIGILGWSYGGYLTAWSISQNHMFKAASIGGGITNLISYAGTNDLPDFVSDALGGDFWNNNLKIYLDRSPIFYAKNIQTPTLLEYGQDDTRVPPSQGYELYSALIKLHIPVELLIYPNTHHSIRIPDFIVYAAKQNIKWFNKYLAPKHEDSFQEATHRPAGPATAAAPAPAQPPPGK